MLKRLVSLFLVTILVFNLAACSKATIRDNAGTKTEGMYYAEEELGGASNWADISGIRLNSKKQMILYDQGTNYISEGDEAEAPRFITLDADGKEVSSFECKHKLEEGKFLTRSLFVLDNKDNIYLMNEVTEESKETDATEKTEAAEATVVTEVTEGTFKSSTVIYVYAPDGSLTKTLELGENNGEMDYAYSILVDTEGNLYICSMTGLKVYGQDGKLIKKTDSDKIITADIAEDGSFLFVSRGEGQLEIEKYDPVSGQTVWQKGLKEGSHPNAIFFSPIDKNIYISDDNEISKYDSQGNYINQLLDYGDTGIIPNEQYISGFVVAASNRIYITMMQQSGDDRDKPFKFYKYTLTKDDGSRASQKLLTISIMNQDTMLESMAKKFQQKHPNIKVKIKSMSERRLSVSDEEIKKFNAEIMSGKASDLICLEGLPYKKYIDKNIFADISEIISRDSTFDMNQLYKNIIEACKYKGKLYSMPVSFTFDALQADGALTDAQGIKLEGDNWTWETFAEAARKASGDKNGDGKTDIYGLAKEDPLKLFEYIFSSSMKQYVDMENKQCHFDSEEFIELLEMVKVLSSKDVMHSTLDYDALFQGSSRGTIGFSFIEDMNNFAYAVSKSMLGDKAEVHAMPLSGEDMPRTFDATMYAISSSSELKEEAWEFIKFMTSDETFGRNNPINKNASEKMLKEMMKSETSSVLMVSDESGKTKTINIGPLTNDQYEHIKLTIASLGQLNDYNLQLKAIIEGELKSYLNDQRSAEDVAKLIQNRVNIYLNE